MRRNLTTLISTTVLSSFLALAPMAASSQASTSAVPGAAAVEGGSYTHQDLERFVAAAQQVAVLTQEYAPKVQATESETDREKVVQEADQKMVKAVEGEGLSVEKFLSINQAAQTDAELQRRLTEISQ